MKLLYHSALDKEQYTEEHCDYHEFKDGSLVFYNDVNYPNDLINHFAECDVLYTDLSWKAGIDKFNDRSEHSQEYQDYIDSINALIEYFKRPTFIVAGITEGRYLSIPMATMDIKLNYHKAKLYCYNVEVQVDFSTTEDLLHFLADSYMRVGDFCCGYGRSGHIFKEKGKHFTMSDYNKHCVAYIKNNFE